MAGPTREERAIADAQVQAAAAAVTVLQRRLDKMVLRAPAEGEPADLEPGMTVWIEN